MDASGGRYTVTNAPLRFLILNAFELQDAQLSGGPDWIDSARFDIIATRGDAPPEQIPAMMRSLLSERFKLKAHRETREMPRYVLVAARTDRRLGAKLVPANCEEN